MIHTYINIIICKIFVVVVLFHIMPILMIRLAINVDLVIFRMIFVSIQLM